MTNKLGSANPNRIPQSISKQLKQLNLNKGVNLEKDRRKKNRRCENMSIKFKDRRKIDRRKKI